MISSPQQAIESLRSAETIWERLAAKDPENNELQDRLAVCQMKIGELLQITGDRKGALNMLTRAHAILEPLARRNAQAPLFQANLADCLTTLGLVRADLESPDEALATLQKARVIRERLVKRSPNDIAYQTSLAEVINNLGYVYYTRLDYPAALHAFQEMQEICQSLLTQIPYGPKPVRVLDWLARSYYNKATIQLRLDQNEQSLRSLEQSLEYRSALVAGHPSVISFQVDLGGGYREIASRQHFAHRDDKAFASVQQSLEVLERVVQSHPDEASYHSELAQSWNTLGYLRDEARDNLKSLPAFRRAVAEQERAVSLSNDVNEYKVLLSIQLDNLGEQYIDLGEVDEGLGYYLKALRIREWLYLAHPGNREYALDFIQAGATVGAIQRHAGRVGAARESFTRARELLEQLAALHPGDAAIAGRLGTALTHEAVALAEEPKSETALNLLARAPLIS